MLEHTVEPVLATACRQAAKGTCDRRGLVGVVCDHSIFLLGVIMTKGENWRYATMLLSELIASDVIPLAVFYDINCRYHPFFFKWLNARLPHLSPACQAAALLMHFPLPPFHAYMHNAECRKQHSLTNPAFPASIQPCGEPAEEVWSEMVKLMRLRYATWEYANIFLENIISDINTRHVRRLAAFLVRRVRDLTRKIIHDEQELKEFLSCLPGALQDALEARGEVCAVVLHLCAEIGRALQLFS